MATDLPELSRFVARWPIPSLRGSDRANVVRWRKEWS